MPICEVNPSFIKDIRIFLIVLTLKLFLFFREVGGSGTIYEGRFFYDGEREGMGEVEFEDGSKEVGNWTYGYRQGSFEYFDENGVKTSEKIYNEYDDYEREKRNILWIEMINKHTLNYLY